MKKLIILLLCVPLVSKGQSQMLNGIEINGPNGFEKTENLTWQKGNDIINVMSINQKLSNSQYEETCKNASRTTEYISSTYIEINNQDYLICLQIGENDMLIGQSIVYRDGYTFIITTATDPSSYNQSEMVIKSNEQIGYMLGYMITRISLF